MKIQAIIPTAGIGKRFGQSQPKTLCLLKNKPLFIHTLEVFEQLSSIHSVILVVHAQYVNEYEDHVRKYHLSKVKKIVHGEETRTGSVLNGLKNLDSDTNFVVIHDGARPLIKAKIIEGAVKKAIEKKAVVVGVPVKPTIKEVDKKGTIIKTLDRSTLWEIQTPQIFEKEMIVSSYTQVGQKHTFTDDASVLEHLNLPVTMFEGDYSNIKITTPEDMIVAEALMNNVA